MNRTILAGHANPTLATAVAAGLGTTPGKRDLRRFPDGELYVEIEESVRGHDVYLIQPTSPPADQHLFELLFLADACRRAGAARLTAVMPYFGYARQDRRATGREAVGARLVADVLAASGLERVVAVDLHSPALEGFFAVPLEHLSAVPVLADACRPFVGPDTVIVAPDLGAAKLADRYARLLRQPVAIVHKTRVSGESVMASGITGDVGGRKLVVVDDMISTGGTIEAAIRVALAAGGVPEVFVVATHGLFVEPAGARLGALPIRRLIVSDSVMPPTDFPIPVQTVSLGPLLADAIARLNEEKSLSDLIAHV